MASKPSQPDLKPAQPDEKSSSITAKKAMHVVGKKRRERRSFAPKNIMIYLTICFATFPLLIVACILIILVYSNLGNTTFAHGKSVLPELQLPSDRVDNSVYLVDFSATQLTTLASWASSIATLMPGVLIGLYGYRVAKAMIRYSETASTDDLPTPYQLSLLLGTYTGGILILWDWISYLFSKRRQKMVPVFTFALIIFAASSTLAYMIWAADTWFHVMTSTAQVSIVYGGTDTWTFEWGFGIAPSCEGLYNSDIGPNWWNCTQNYVDKGTRINSGYALMANIDPDRVLISAPSNGSSSEISFISGGKGLPFIDYIATTFGFSASCKLATKECGMRYYDLGGNGAWMYNCTPAFHGVLASDLKNFESDLPCRSFGYGCYGLYSNDSFLDSTSIAGPANINPLAVGVAAQVVGLAEELTFDDEIVSAYDFSNFILVCQVDVFDIKYSVLNGSTTILSSTPSNDTVTYISTGWDALEVGAPAVQNSIVIAATTATTSTDEMVTSFASSLSKIFAAFSVDSFVETRNLLQQTRETMLVARVPKAPFFTLLILCLMLSLLGLLMGIVTLASSPSLARAVHTRLSVAGVMAAHFEDAEQVRSKASSASDLFAERGGRKRNVRVGIKKSDQGGWVFQTFHEHDEALLNTEL
jgi:hypothetical protein